MDAWKFRIHLAFNPLTEAVSWTLALRAGVAAALEGRRQKAEAEG